MTKALLITLFIFTSFITTAQIITDGGSATRYDNRLLKYYSVEELDEMRINRPTELKSYEYYFQNSYIIETVAGTDCVDYDLANFDILGYEASRSWNSRITIDLSGKHCIRIILLSTAELEYKLTIHDLQILYQQNNN